MTALRMSAFLAALLVGSGICAEAQTRSGYGGQARVSRLSSVARLQGELIAVSPDTVWLLKDSTLLSIPSSDVLRVQVKRRPIGAAGIFAWGLIGGAVSGVALTAACGSYEDGNCVPVLPAVLLSWGLWSGIWAAVAGSAYSTYLPDQFQSDLRAFARFPQGLPSWFDPAWLRSAPRQRSESGR